MRPDRPAAFANVTSNLVSEAMLEAIDETLANFESGSRSQLLIFGPEGTGKTTAAALAHAILQRHGYLVWWLSAQEFDPKVDTGIVSSASQCKVLFVDDLGKEPPWARPSMANIVAARTLRPGLTVFTTNVAVNPDDPDVCGLTPLYGAAMRSRMVGDCLVVEYNGPDRRTR